VPATLALSTANLNRLIDYPAADMTVTVEAGMTISELQRQLAAQRQWLPIDVPWPDRATVGGAIARNAAGPRRYAYGTMRDYLLGFTAVDGTGMAFSGGGRVVKNAAGYNMCRLMAGSLGALGIITQATLMVRPLPEAAALLACEVADFDLAERLLASLVRSPARPVAVELAAGRPHDGNPLFGPVSQGNVARLYIGFEGSAIEVDWMLGRLRDEWTALGMTSPVLMPNIAADRLWRWIAEFPADARICVLPSELIGRIVEVLKIAPDCAVHAHAGNGVIHVSCANNSRELTAPGEATKTTPSLRELLAPGYCDDDTPERITPEIRVMRAIKERFDPKNILNPLLYSSRSA
jgi:glycolate oxidase FAD binding subunit